MQDDTLYEGPETATLTLASPSAGLELGDPTKITGDIDITDNDSPPLVSLGLTGSPLAENGGIAKVTATLSNPSVDDATVTLGFGGSATGCGTGGEQSFGRR